MAERIFSLPLCSQNVEKIGKMSELSFTKMHGAGNDYIYVNCMKSCPDNLSSLSERLSDRHKGIGADGLVLILPSDVADFRMRMFNADGSEGRMCGNAARCVGKYVFEKGLTSKHLVTLETLSGIKRLDLHVADGIVESVTVDMGCPVLEAADVPVHSTSIKGIKVETSRGEVSLTAVSMGNPHGVVFCSLDDVDVHGLGRELEVNPIFPDRANIEFVEVLASDHLRMRVWERGSGETMACGTGACASLVAGALTDHCGRHAVLDLLGGQLEVEWRESDNHVYLSGPAEFSFEGTVRI